MIPAFVIHDLNNQERKSTVKELQSKAKAVVVPAIVLEKGHEGCLRSHIKVAELAQTLYPDSHYIVFEDDCVLEEGWDDILKEFPTADLVYLGYTEASQDTIFGTHGMYMSPRLRDILIGHGVEYAFKVRFPWAADWVIPKLCKDYGLEVFRPAYKYKEKWAYQKRGLTSQITGKVRK